ncbi:MAG: HU family DNA-binding protein [Planctomycetota bacterium]
MSPEPTSKFPSNLPRRPTPPPPPPSRPPPPPPPVAKPAPDDAPRTITKKELVARIAERTGQTKVVARDILQMFLDEIIKELGRGNRLEFREFGVFEIKERAARKAQNPRTLEKVDVPSKRVVKFRVGRLMKERVGEIPEGSQFIADGSDDYDDDDDDE